MNPGAWTRFARIDSPEMLARVRAAAAADAHTSADLHHPTHALLRGDEIVGAMAIGSSVLVEPWFHTQKMQRRESFSVINAATEMLRLQGVKSVMVPFGPQSPFNKVAQSLGFESAKYWNCHYKEL